MNARGRAVGGLAMLLLASAVPVQAANYYEGKRLTVLINYAVGGPADIEGRVVARHLGRMIAGNPTIVVQNMDGAGGVVGTNFLGEIAPKDGTTLGLLTGAAWTYVGKPDSRRVDFKTYEFVAFQPGTSIYFIRADVKPGIKSPVDLGKAEGVISGGLGADNSKDMLLRLTLEMLGHKYKYVTGYRGSAAARLALQQGEINFYSESPPSYRGVIEPTLVKSGEVVGLFFDPSYDGKEFRRPRQVEGMDMISFPELYEKIKGEPPKGELWEAYKKIISLNGAMQRMVALPPGAPAEAIAALRAGFNKLNTDKEFAEEANKTFGYSPEYYAGNDASERVRGALTTTPEFKKFIEGFVNRGSQN